MQDTALTIHASLLDTAQRDYYCVLRRCMQVAKTGYTCVFPSKILYKSSSCICRQKESLINVVDWTVDYNIMWFGLWTWGKHLWSMRPHCYICFVYCCLCAMPSWGTIYVTEFLVLGWLLMIILEVKY